MIKRLNNLTLLGAATLMTSPVFAAGLNDKKVQWFATMDSIVDIFLYAMLVVGIIFVGIGVLQLIQSGKNQQITVKDWGLKILGGGILGSLAGFVVFAQESTDLGGDSSKLAEKAKNAGFTGRSGK